MSKIEVLTGGGVAIIDDSDPDGILCVKTITPDEIPALLAALLGQAGAKICYVGTVCV